MDELQGFPSPEETMRVLYGAQQPAQQSQATATMPEPQGLPSPEETMAVLYQNGYQPGQPNTHLYQSGQTPVQQDQQTQQDYTNTRAGQIIQERMTPDVTGFQPLMGTHGLTNPVLSGLRQSAYNFAHPLAIAGNYLTGGNLDISGALLDERAAEKEAQRKLLGGEQPFHEKIIEGITTAVGDVRSMGGFGLKAYLGSMFARTYDQSLQEANRAGIQGPQAHTYAATNGAIEVGTEMVMQKLGKGIMGKMFPKTSQDPSGAAAALKQTIRQRLLDIGKTAGEEGLEEAITQIGQNANSIAHGLKPAKWESLFEGVGEAATIGAGSGGVVGGIHHVQEARQQRQITPQNPQGTPRPAWAPQETTQNGTGATSSDMERHGTTQNAPLANQQQPVQPQTPAETAAPTTPQHPTVVPTPAQEAPTTEFPNVQTQPVPPHPAASEQTPPEAPKAAETVQGTEKAVEATPESARKALEIQTMPEGTLSPEAIQEGQRYEPPQVLKHGEQEQPNLIPPPVVPQAAEAAPKPTFDEWKAKNKIEVRHKATKKGNGHWYVTGNTASMARTFKERGGTKTGKVNEWRFESDPSSVLQEAFNPPPSKKSIVKAAQESPAVELSPEQRSMFGINEAGEEVGQKPAEPMKQTEGPQQELGTEEGAPVPDEYVRNTEDKFFNTKRSQSPEPDHHQKAFDALKKLAGPTNKAVDVREWRKATGLSKAEFDSAALHLINNGHVMPQKGEALGRSKEQVAEMVHRPLPAEESRGHGEHAPGEYYVTAKPVAGSPYKSKRMQGNKPPGKKAEVVVDNAGPRPEKPISVHDIRATMAKWFNTAFLRGRVPQSGEAFYKWHEEVSRVAGQEWGNLAIISHELGHHLDKTNDQMLNGFSNAAKAELSGLDYDTDRKSFQEGFAEFTRIMLTTDDAAKQAPQTHKEFTDWVKNNPEIQKKLWDTYLLVRAYRNQHPLDRIMANWWESGRKAMAMKIDPKTGKISFDVGITPEKFAESIDRIMSGFYGETYVPEKVGAEAEAKMLEQGKTLPRTRVGETINFMHGSDRAMAEHAIFHGIYTMSHETDAAPTKLSDGMFEILKSIDTDEKWNEFWGYYDALAARSRVERLPGYNPGMLPEDMHKQIADVEGDATKKTEYQKVAKDVRQFLGALVDLQVDGGVITAEDAKRIKDSEEFYMPRFRVREHGLLGGVRRFASDVGKRMFGVKPSAQRVSETGSADSYATPFDAIIRQTMQTYNAVTHQAMASAMVHVMDPALGGAEGMGRYLTRVDAGKAVDRVKLEALLDGLTKPGEINGVPTDPVIDQVEAERLKKVARWRDGARSDELRRYMAAAFNIKWSSAIDADIDEAIKSVPGLKQFIAFWKGDFGEKPDEHIFRYIHNGDEIFYQVPYTPLYEGVMGQGNSVNATIFSRIWVGIANGWNKVFTTPIKLGAVTLNPAYIGPAMMMDYVNFTLHSKHTGAAERFFAPLQTLGQLIAAKLTGRDDALVRVLEEYGGKISSQRFGAPKSSAAAITKEIRAKTPMERLKSKLIYNTFETVKDFVGTADTGMRLAEAYGVAKGNGFSLTDDKTKWNYPDGTVHDDIPVWLAIKMVNASNEVLTNFKRKGTVSRELDKIVPFLSAGIAGTARSLETTRDIATRKGEGWEKRALAACALATASLAYAWAHSDDEEREGLDRTIADRYWTFKAFGFDIVRIPKPRGFLWIPNMMEAFVDLATKGKTDRTGNALWTTFEDLMPPMRPAGASTIWDIARNKDWTGHAIENRQDIDDNIAKEYRDTPNTLGMSKALSHAEKAILGEHMQAWGLSPVQIEYILDQQTGSAYSDYVGFFGERLPQGKLDPHTAPVLRRFTFKSLHQRSINEFYDDYEKVKGRAKTAKKLGQEDTEAELQLKQMDRYKGALSDMRKVLRTATTTKEKLVGERYLVGIADYANGQEQRESFPNPLRKDAKDLPEAVQKIRQQFVLSLAQSIAAEPSPKSIRSPEDLKTFKERAARDDVQDRWAVGELKRLGYSQQDVMQEFIKASVSKGRKPSPVALGRVVAEMGKKD